MKRWKFDSHWSTGRWRVGWRFFERSLWHQTVTTLQATPIWFPQLKVKHVHVRQYTCPWIATWAISCCHIIVHVNILNVNKTLTAIKCESNSDWFKRIFTSFRESKWRNQHKIVKHFYRNRLFKVFLGYIHRPHPFKLLICRRQKQLFAFDCHRRPMCWSQLFWWWP